MERVPQSSGQLLHSSFKSRVLVAFPDILSKLSHFQQNEPSPLLLSRTLLLMAPAILIDKSGWCPGWRIATPSQSAQPRPQPPGVLGMAGEATAEFCSP